jgi:2,4-dienoyl-CoA reductase-like NADH-dependent reductase (Old Yellow Enzyme family)
MAKLVKIIQKQGASAVVQLSHAGPRCPPVPGKRHGFSPPGPKGRV